MERHAIHEGLTETPIAGVRLFRISQPMERLPAVYPPSMCLIVQGEKRAYLGGVSYTYDVDHYLCATMALPVEAEVPAATPATPVLGVMLDLDTRVVAETRVAYEAAAEPHRSQSGNELAPGMVAVAVDAGFVAVVGRLLELLDDPVALSVLAEARLRELLFALIEGDAGPVVRRTAPGTREIAHVLTYLHEHIREPHTVDELAHRAGMSRAVFHREFKVVTGFSPLQFVKAIRLTDAAMQIVAGTAVSQAAERVWDTPARRSSAASFADNSVRRPGNGLARRWCRPSTLRRAPDRNSVRLPTR